MTLQTFRQTLVLVAVCACKCRGGMTLQKSAFRWRHEAANWQAVAIDPGLSTSPMESARGCAIGPMTPNPLSMASLGMETVQRE